MSLRVSNCLLLTAALAVGCGDRDPFGATDTGGGTATSDVGGTDGATTDTATSDGSDGAQTDVVATDGSDGTSIDGSDGTDGIDGSDGTLVDGTDGSDGTAVDGTDGSDGTAVDGTDGSDGTTVDGTDATDGTATDGTDATDGTATDGTDATDGFDGLDGVCDLRGTLQVGPDGVKDDTSGAPNAQGVQGLECGTNIETGLGSPDHTWGFSAPYAGEFTFTISGTTFDSALYVLDACSKPYGCLDLKDNLDSGTAEAVVLDLDKGQEVFVVVDGYLNESPGVAGAYTLSVTASSVCEPACTGKACGDDGCGGVCGICDPTDTCSGGACVPVSTGGAALIINELDYDQVGSDAAEFIEIYNAGTGPATLSEYAIELVNGGDGKVYKTIQLGGAGPSLGAGEYLVAGVKAVTDTLPAGVLKVVVSDASGGWLQNGGPDGVRLSKGGTIVDAVAYEGALAASGEGAAAAADSNDAPGDLSRCPNGADANDNAADFALVVTLTPGKANDCNTTPVASPFEPTWNILKVKCAPCHVTSGAGGTNLASTNIATAYAQTQLMAFGPSGKTKGEVSLDRIKTGNMPKFAGCSGDPSADAANPKCLNALEMAIVTDWIAKGQPGP